MREERRREGRHVVERRHHLDNLGEQLRCSRSIWLFFTTRAIRRANTSARRKGTQFATHQVDRCRCKSSGDRGGGKGSSGKVHSEKGSGKGSVSLMGLVSGAENGVIRNRDADGRTSTWSGSVEVELSTRTMWRRTPWNLQIWR